MINVEEHLIDKTMLEIVAATRRIHFKAGSSSHLRTKVLKEIIEENAKGMSVNAAGKNNDN